MTAGIKCVLQHATSSRAIHVAARGSWCCSKRDCIAPIVAVLATGVDSLVYGLY